MIPFARPISTPRSKLIASRRCRLRSTAVRNRARTMQTHRMCRSVVFDRSVRLGEGNETTSVKNNRVVFSAREITIPPTRREEEEEEGGGEWLGFRSWNSPRLCESSRIPADMLQRIPRIHGEMADFPRSESSRVCIHATNFPRDLDHDRRTFERDWPFDRWIFNFRLGLTIATIVRRWEFGWNSWIKLSWRMLFRGCSPSYRLIPIAGMKSGNERVLECVMFTIYRWPVIKARDTDGIQMAWNAIPQK